MFRGRRLRIHNKFSSLLKKKKFTGSVLLTFQKKILKCDFFEDIFQVRVRVRVMVMARVSVRVIVMARVSVRVMVFLEFFF